MEVLLDQVARHIREVIVADDGGVGGSAEESVVDAGEEGGGTSRAGRVCEHLRVQRCSNRGCNGAVTEGATVQ